MVQFHKKNQYIYRFPQLELINSFNLINIEAIRDIVHIIPRFNLNNKYFVNKFIQIFRKIKNQSFKIYELEK